MKPKKNIITKVAGAAIKAATKSAKPSLKTAQKAKPLANPKSGVKVKPAAKQQAGEKDIMTLIKKRAVRNEQISQAQKNNSSSSGLTDSFSMGKTKLMRQVKASNKKKSK